MKNLSILILLTFLLFSSFISKPTHFAEDTFKVYGNCEMCKMRIEKSLEVNGVSGARWGVTSKIITVNYNPHVISLVEIHTLIAKKGYDTDRVRANDYIYSQLPKCCQYKRASLQKDSIGTK